MRKIEKAFSHLNLKQKWEEKSRDGWKEQTTNQKIIESEPYHIDSYEKLIDAIAQISFYNRDYALFYRGQKREYLDDSNCAKIFPQIYRKDDNYNLEGLWEKLNETDRKLKVHFEANYKKFAGTSIFLKYGELRWAIMQHYLVEKTPILDVTHSPYVAASFAQFKNKNNNGIIYVLGASSFSNTIDIFPEDDLVLIRLLSFCLPKAKRPYLQEAYAIGPYPNFKLNQDSEKYKFNFSRRLIAKFSIPNSKSFWGDGYSAMPDHLLDYENDSIEQFLAAFRIDYDRVFGPPLK